jgi:hypothetical protein
LPIFAACLAKQQQLPKLANEASSQFYTNAKKTALTPESN